MDKSTHERQPLSIGAALLLVTVGIFFMAWKSTENKTIDQAKTTDENIVHITSPDSITLTASLIRPTTPDKAPALILLHEYAKDHHQWDSYVASFQAAGFVVLSLDMRGFGESRLRSIPTSLDDVFASLPKDVTAAIDYLQTLSFVDQQRINVLGVALGANTAFVASSLEPRIAKTGLVSPIASPAVFTGYGMKDFQPRNVAGWIGADDASTLNAFMKPVTGKHEQHNVTDGGQGLSLLQTSGVLDSIVAWLKS